MARIMDSLRVVILSVLFSCAEGWWWPSENSGIEECPDDLVRTIPLGHSCASISWEELYDGAHEEMRQHYRYYSGDCFPEGTYTFRYEKDDDVCYLHVIVKAVRCSSEPYIPHSSRSCTHGTLYNSVCTYVCHDGYVMRGADHSRCQSNRVWTSTPSCYESCSWVKNYCWPGNCSGDLASNCVCLNGFKLRSGGAKICDLDTPPDFSTCRLSVSGPSGETKASGYIGTLTNCVNQRDEWINFQPVNLTFTVKANFHMNLGPYPMYIKESRVGVTGARVSLSQVLTTGNSRALNTIRLNTRTYCQRDVTSLNPTYGNEEHSCHGTVHATSASLADGERLCVASAASSGGFYNLQDKYTNNQGQRTFLPLTQTKTVCFTYDGTEPAHCSASTHSCGSEPLQLSTRKTRTPEVVVHIEGWSDPGPSGSASQIEKYRLEVHAVDKTPTSLSVQKMAVGENFTKMWEAGAGGPYDVTMPLPEEGAARLYAIMLEVHDKAGNVAYARRLVLYDNTSAVELFPGRTLKATTADTSTNLAWQTDVSQKLCVDWTNRFYNPELTDFVLMPVTPDTGSGIDGVYDQQSGVLPVTGTDNVQGVSKFELMWNRDNSARSEAEEISDLFAQNACLREPVRDGETYTVWIKATDIMNNSKEDSVRVSIDHTGPVINIVGLRGRFGRDGLYVHNTTDLSTMLLLLHAKDPHSGLKTLNWSLGTPEESDSIRKGTVGIQRLDNITTCGERSHCYCPAVGPCEVSEFLVSFTSLVRSNRQYGQNNHHYVITTTVTNHASLTSTQSVTILIDDSPPSTGFVEEGLGDEDLDFTAFPEMDVRWSGFVDNESGILMYRVAVAKRCLSGQKMDVVSDAVDVANGSHYTLQIPSEGHYFTSVVAYNGALEPSQVTCSDGFTFSTNPDDCPVGHYIDPTNDYSCTPCPVNTYSDRQHQYSCIKCPQQLETNSTGAMKLADCRLPIGVNVTTKVELKYELSEVCTPSNENATLTTLQERMTNFSQDWPTLCADTMCTNVRFTATCEDPLSKNVVAVLTFYALPGTLTSAENVTMTTRDVLQTIGTDGGIFDLKDIGAQLSKNGAIFRTQMSCQPGFKTSGSTCVATEDDVYDEDGSLLSSSLIGAVAGSGAGVIAVIIVTVIVIKVYSGNVYEIVGNAKGEGSKQRVSHSTSASANPSSAFSSPIYGNVEPSTLPASTKASANCASAISSPIYGNVELSTFSANADASEDHMYANLPLKKV